MSEILQPGVTDRRTLLEMAILLASIQRRVLSGVPSGQVIDQAIAEVMARARGGVDG